MLRAVRENCAKWLFSFSGKFDVSLNCEDKI